MEIRFKLNPKIKRDKVIINWLSDIPKRERAVLIKERLANSINNIAPPEIHSHTSRLHNTDIDKTISKFSNF